MQGRNLLADDRILRSFVDIDLGPVRVIFGHVGVGKNGFHRAFRNTRITIDAGIGIDIKSIR